MLVVPNSTLQANIDAACNFIEQGLVPGKRSIIGIAGPPASGKTTLAEAIVERINAMQTDIVPKCSLVSMDGYHLDNASLEEKGLLAKKGAPETFNVEGFCEAVKNLSNTNSVAYYPGFDRDLDQTIDNVVAVHPQTSIIIVEGNYLLLNISPWNVLKKMFSSTIFLGVERHILEQRLHQRWATYGLDPRVAEQRILLNDMVNAELVLQDSQKADLYSR